MRSPTVPPGNGGCQRKAFSAAVMVVTTPQDCATVVSGGRSFARRSWQIPAVAKLPATPMVTVSSKKGNGHGRCPPNCASTYLHCGFR